MITEYGTGTIICLVLVTINCPGCIKNARSSCGSGFHHAFPGSAKLGILPGQSDPGWWVLKGLQKAGLVSDIKTDKDLPARDDLVAIPVTPAKPGADVLRRYSTRLYK